MSTMNGGFSINYVLNLLITTHLYKFSVLFSILQSIITHEIGILINLLISMVKFFESHA